MKKYLALSVLILLVACNTISGPRRYTTGAMSIFTYAAADSLFPIVVVSNPLSVSKNKLEALILTELDNNWSYLRTKFVAKNPGTTTSYRIVFVFNPSKEIYGNRICTANQSDVLSSQGVTEIVAAFCSENAHTEIRANFEIAQNLKNKDLTDAISFLTWQVVPEDRQRKGNLDNQ